jgi:transcriptional regulator NrdR family protein
VKRKPRPAPRARGGAACPCPSCGGVTRVLRTTRRADEPVERRRQCVARKCGARFTTRELYWTSPT